MEEERKHEVNEPERKDASDQKLTDELKGIAKGSEESKEKKKEPKPRIFLEIGPWLSSTALRGNRHYTGNDLYIGLEKTMAGKEQGMGNYDDYKEGFYEVIAHRPDEPHERGKYASTTARNRSIAEVERPDENIEFMYGDMRHIPLPDNSVHEIFAGNVFGQNQHDFGEAVDEFSRVTEPGAQLIIKETTTPVYPNGLFDKPGRLFGDFIVERLVRGDDPEYVEMNKKYGENMNDIAYAKDSPDGKQQYSHNMYYAVLRKASKEEIAQIMTTARAELKARLEKDLDANEVQASPDRSSASPSAAEKAKGALSKARKFFKR